MSRLKLGWAKWFQGILAAVIGGAANTVCAIAVDPVAFNFNDLPKLGKMAVGAAVISLAFYLKQSPVPPEEPEQKQ